MQSQNSDRQLRSFGLTVGGIFLFIGMWPVVRRGLDPGLWALVVGALLVIAALIFPASLRGPRQVWMRVGHVLGWINNKIILGLMFYLVFTPVAVILRLIGHDPMNRSFVPKTDTYRVPRQPRNTSHMKHQF